MNITKKDYSVSLIRFIAMASVICCHTFEYTSPILGEKEWILRSIGNYCANGVQIFFLISGFLYGKRDGLFPDPNGRVSFVLRNFKKILFDYWAYCILVMLPIYYFLAPETINLRSILGVLTTSDVIGGVHHLWFIPYILLCYLLTPILYDIKNYLLSFNKKHYLFWTLAILIVLTWVSYFFNSYFFSAWVCIYIIGFFLPEMSAAISDERHKKTAIAVIVLICIILNIFRYYAGYIRPELFVGDIRTPVCNWLVGWSQNFFALVVFFIIYGKVIKSKKLKRLLDYSDKYSYDIYLAHMIYVKGVLSTIFLTGHIWFNYIVTFALAAASGIALYHLCRFIERILKRRKREAV